jgi:hypothetical protein
MSAAIQEDNLSVSLKLVQVQAAHHKLRWDQNIPNQYETTSTQHFSRKAKLTLA